MSAVVLGMMLSLTSCLYAQEPGPAVAPSEVPIPTSGDGAPGPIATGMTPEPGAGDPDAGPSASPGPSATPGADDVAAFQQRCEQGFEEWRSGEVEYPADLAVSIDGSTTYNAAIDIREESLTDDQLIESGGGEVETEPVLVKCVVAARLATVGTGLAVEEDVGSVEGWVVRNFTPAGIVEWSWTVTAVDPGEQQLRLDLRPAIIVSDAPSDVEYGTENVSSFVTDVHVEASLLRLTGSWFQANWPYVVIIAGAAGTAIIAVIRWLGKLRAEVRQKPHPASAETKS